MDPRPFARGLAASRIAYGATIALAPAFTGPTWFGARAARRPSTRVMTRAMGARDAALGVMALRALAGADPAPARAVMGALAVADATDLLATLGERRGLARGPAAFSALVAAG